RHVGLATLPAIRRSADGDRIRGDAVQVAAGARIPTDHSDGPVDGPARPTGPAGQLRAATTVATLAGLEPADARVAAVGPRPPPRAPRGARRAPRRAPAAASARAPPPRPPPAPPGPRPPAPRGGPGRGTRWGPPPHPPRPPRPRGPPPRPRQHHQRHPCRR